MKHQNDWYTGINHHDHHKKEEVKVEHLLIDKPIEQFAHEMVEMIYVKSGDAIIEINGSDYQAVEGRFFCLYSHHFYKIHSIKERLDVVSIKFYIGLFMYMSWEKHPKNANAKLVYDTCPSVDLDCKQKDKIEYLVLDILREKEERRFGSLNLIEYKTLELHGYFCRYAFEQIGVHKKENNKVWAVIERTILTTNQKSDLKDLAVELDCSARTLNQDIKKACGYTFFQLQQFGKIINACALLRFPELSIEYISDLLNFSSITSFYRVFVQHCGVSPRVFQNSFNNSPLEAFTTRGLAMQFLQYMHIYFSEPISLDKLCEAFYIKPYTAKQIFDTAFGKKFSDLLSEIRICYAASFLRTTDYSALEISLMCGFNSYSSFQSAFKTHMNQTPAEFRKSM